MSARSAAVVASLRAISCRIRSRAGMAEGAQRRGEGRPVQLDQLVAVVGQLPAHRAVVADDGPCVRDRPWADPLLEPVEDPERVGGCADRICSSPAGGPLISLPPAVVTPVGELGRIGDRADRKRSRFDFT